MPGFRHLRPFTSTALLFALLLPAALPATPLEDSPVRPEALHGENLPEVPGDLWKEIRRYQEIHGSSFVDWHPSGQGILARTRSGNLSQLHHVPSPGATPVLRTPGDEPTTRGFYLPDGTLVFVRSRGGDENYQIYARHPESGEVSRLSDGTSRHLLGEPHPDGRRVAFSSTRRNGRDGDLYLQEAKAGAEARRIYEVGPGELWWVADWSPDGRQAIIARYISRNESLAHLLDLETGKTRPLPSEKTAGQPMVAERIYRSSFHFGPGGRSVYLLSDARGEFRELVRVDLAGGETRWITPGISWDVESLALSEDRRQAVITVNVDGYSRLHHIDLEALESSEKSPDAPNPMRELSLFPALISSVEFSPDGKRLGLTLGRPTSPAEAHELELDGGKLTRWTLGERAGFQEDDFVAPDLIRYSTFDDREVPAFLFRPHRSEDPLPVIITIHGGPESQYRPWFSPSRQLYTNFLGAAVIAPNVRGSTGYGKTYSLLDNGKKREDSVRDIGALLEWISTTGKSRHGLDPERVAVSGGSYGGYMVLASLIHFGDRLSCGVDSVGISDFTTFLENTSAYRRDLRRAEYGDERDPEMRAFFRKISPARRIHELDAALLLVHGENDPRVPFSEALQIVEGARQAGNEVWTLYARNEGHGFRRKENSDYLQAIQALFFRRFLFEKPGESTSSLPAGATTARTLIARRNELLQVSPAVGEARDLALPAVLELEREVEIDHVVLEVGQGAKTGRPLLLEVSGPAGNWQAVTEGRVPESRSVFSFQPIPATRVRLRIQGAEPDDRILRLAAYRLLEADEASSYREILGEVERGTITSGIRERLDAHVEKVPHYAEARRLRGRVLEELRHHRLALADYDLAVALEPGRGVDQLFRGNALFKLGRFEESVKAYDDYARGNRYRSASCWQRGLAWYYLGEYEKGKKQFEGYHSVDDLDIENGIWRYLCIAESSDLEKARATFLPYPTKVRPPFPELHRLYAGEGTPEEVVEAARRRASSPGALERNLFYGHYYIAKYHEVRRDLERARESLKTALGHEIPHFMYDCARIDLGRVERALETQS